MRRIAAVLVALLTLLAPVPSHALFHISQIDEVMSGAAGNANLQYVQIKMLAGAQTFVANARLTFFSCSAGNPAAKLVVVGHDLATGNAGTRWILASPDDATFFAASGIHPDFTFAPGIDNACGMICWGAPVASNFQPPADPNSWDVTNLNNYVDCWAYGGYSGPMKTGALVTAGTAGDGTHSLVRSGSSAILACPAPTNDAGDMGSFAGTCAASTTTTITTTTTTTLAGAAPGCSDAQAAATTRAQIAAQCPCAGATNHQKYVKCAAGVVKDAVKGGTLPKSCKGPVKKCAASSTCGRPGFVTCCRTNAKGVRTCSVKKSAGACKAPKRGAACVGSLPSCCDACAGTSCSTPTLTPSAGVTTTTRPRLTPTTMPPY
jgi:hypothetical protein